MYIQNIQLSIVKKGTPTEFLHCIQELSQAETKLGYSTTYPKLESGLEQLLQGNGYNE